MKKTNKLERSLLFAFCFMLNAQGMSQELPRYTCQADRMDISIFESTRQFDKDDGIMSSGKYHPLSISRYGVIAYYNFLDTGDSIFYYKSINQIEYFRDSKKINLIIDGKGIGLPYNFDYNGLKAPWYSGMTQGPAISYLLRYSTLTNDESILSTVEKIAYVLVMPQEKGGTISRTKEGCTRIEEYPNCPRSPQVLNGYINSNICPTTTGIYKFMVGYDVMNPLSCVGQLKFSETETAETLPKYTKTN